MQKHFEAFSVSGCTGIRLFVCIPYEVEASVSKVFVAVDMLSNCQMVMESCELLSDDELLAITKTALILSDFD